MSSPQTTYLFYDIETTGLNKCFDQVVEFAAIRTDLSLHEIERHEIKIKLLPDIIPAPEAIITHRIGIHDMQQGESEIDGIRTIHALLNYPGTISVGYNTLGFDDEFLRFGFYRNLLPAYTHQFANRCSRMDIYPITALYYLFKPRLLHWPTDQTDAISLKLENMNRVNQLATGSSHRAMVDVEVTLALARKLLQAPDMWNYACAAFDKQVDLNRITTLQDAIMVSGRFGAAHCFHAPVLNLGSHLHYKNQTLWLRLDNEKLSQTTPNNIAEHTFVIRKKAGEAQIVLPPHDRFKAHLSPERQTCMEQNMEWLATHPHIFKQIQEYHRHFKYPVVADLDSQAALYETGFPSPAEEKLYTRFHQATAHQKSQLISQFKDPHRRTLAHRLIMRHFSEHATPENQPNYQPFDFRGAPRLTKPSALEQIHAIRTNTTLDIEQERLLNEFESYLLSLS